ARDGRYVSRGVGERKLRIAGQPEHSRVRRPGISARRARPAPGIDGRPRAGYVDAVVKMRPAAASGVPALRDDRAAIDALARTDVNLREVRIAGTESVLMVDDDGLAEAGVDRIRSRQLHHPIGGGQDVLVGERVVPAIVAVVIEVVAAAGRLRVPQRKGG